MGCGASTAMCCCSSQAKVVAEPQAEETPKRVTTEKPALDDSRHGMKSALKSHSMSPRPASDPNDESSHDGKSKKVSLSLSHEVKELPPVPTPRRTDSLVKFVSSVTGKQTPLASVRAEDVKAKKDTILNSQTQLQANCKKVMALARLGKSPRKKASTAGVGVADQARVDTMRDRRFAPLWTEHRRFLVNWVTMLDYGGLKPAALEDKYIADTLRDVVKPKLELRQFKSHTMDNIRLRHMVDEMLYLENPLKHTLPVMKSQTGTVDRELGWMPTVQQSLGKQIHAIKITNNPAISIGGYFIMSQMISSISSLLSLDLSHNGITAADMRVLSLGLLRNKSIQELRLKENRIGSEGAISIAEVLQRNDTLELMDLRSNQIRATGICLLVSAMADNRTLTHLDVRWNFSGQRDDYLHQAMSDLQKFCYRNHVRCIRSMADELRQADIGQIVTDSASSERTPRPAGSSTPLVIASEHRALQPTLGPDGAERSEIEEVPQADGDGAGDRQEWENVDVLPAATIKVVEDVASEEVEDGGGVFDAHRPDAFMPVERLASARNLSDRPDDALKEDASEATTDTHASGASDKKAGGPVPKLNMKPVMAARPVRRQSVLDPWTSNVLHKAGLPWQTHRSQSPIGRLEVTLVGARNLPQVIWTSGKDNEYLGIPQAYCILELGNRQRTRTTIMKKDFAPFWNYKTSFDITHIWQVFSATIMHSRKLSQTHKDDYTIGMIHVPVGDILNWRGVVKDADGMFKAYQFLEDEGEFRICKEEGSSTQAVFDTAEQAAYSYDKALEKKEKAILNFSGDDRTNLGQHIIEQSFSLTGEDGAPVVGVQMGINASCRLLLKYFSSNFNYLEIHLDRGSDFPKMDAGLGTADPYCVLTVVGDWGTYPFKSKIVRNSLDPEFGQTFRLAVPLDANTVEMSIDTYDWDRFDEDDLIGSATIDLTKLLQSPAANLNGPVALSLKDKGDVVSARGTQSKLHLRYTMTLDEEFAEKLRRSTASDGDASQSEPEELAAESWRESGDEVTPIHSHRTNSEEPAARVAFDEIEDAS